MMKYTITLCLISFLLFSCHNNSSSTNQVEKETDVLVNNEEPKGSFIGEPLQTLDDFRKEVSGWMKDLEFESIDSVAHDFDGDGFKDVLMLFRIALFTRTDGTSFKNEDPGDYHLVKITDGKTNEEYEFLNGDGWIKNYYLDELSKDNQGYKSDHFIHYSSGKNNLLIFEGYTYGSGSSTRTIINFYDNEPVLIYNANKKIKAVNSTNDGLSVVINEAAAEEKSIADEEDIYKVDKWLKPIE